MVFLKLMHMFRKNYTKKLNQLPPFAQRTTVSRNDLHEAMGEYSTHHNLMNEEREVEIHIQKVRFREVGKVGLVKLSFNVVTGRYTKSLTF